MHWPQLVVWCVVEGWAQGFVSLQQQQQPCGWRTDKSETADDIQRTAVSVLC